MCSVENNPACAVCLCYCLLFLSVFAPGAKLGQTNVSILPTESPTIPSSVFMEPINTLAVIQDKDIRNLAFIHMDNQVATDNNLTSEDIEINFTKKSNTLDYQHVVFKKYLRGFKGSKIISELQDDV